MSIFVFRRGGGGGGCEEQRLSSLLQFGGHLWSVVVSCGC